MEFLISMGFDVTKTEQALKQANGDVDIALEILLDSTGTQQNNIITEEFLPESVIELGISQYTFSETGGSSACTVISLAVMTKVLECIEEDTDYKNNSILVDAVMEGISSYTALFGESNSHTSVDEILPIFTDKIVCLCETPIQGLLSNLSSFHDLVRSARSISNNNKYTGIIITKPPETVCLILPPVESNGQYILFDSHSRPQLGLESAYMVSSPHLNAIINRLNDLFVALPSDGHDENNYLTIMYNMFE
eukprot:gene13032-17465_t